MSKISNKRVPNKVPGRFKLMLVGESPGDDEELKGEPFVGNSGQFLMSTLANYGVTKDEVALCNLSQYRPEGNKFALLQGSDQLLEGKLELSELIRIHNPQCIIALGAEPFKFLTAKEGKITRWRGSIIPTEVHGAQSKVLASYHPAYILRNLGLNYLFNADIKRGVLQSNSHSLPYAKRDYFPAPTGNDLTTLVGELQNVPILSVDIESVKKSTQILCVGFADSANRAVCLPYTLYYLPYIQTLLSCAAKKIFHNGIFDVTMLGLNGIEVNNYSEDTLLQHHALEPELPRSLEFLASVYTYQPAYKEAGRGEIPEDTKAWSDKTDPNKLYIYNCTDCCVTYEAWEILNDRLDEDRLARLTYLSRFKQQEVAMSIANNGIYVDKIVRQRLLLGMAYRWQNLQFALDVVGKRRTNVNSGPSCQKLLYTDFKLPVRRKQVFKDGQRTSVTTCDEDALVSLITFCQTKIDESKKESTKVEWRVKQDAIKLVLEIRGIRKSISSYLKFKLSSDGRARSTVRVGATNTGRWAANKYTDSSGFNSMTMPRDGFDIPDEIYEGFDPDKMTVAGIAQLQMLLDSVKEPSDEDEEDVDID